MRSEVRTGSTLDEIVDDVGLLHRVQRDEVGAERRAVLARLVPRRVERREPVAGAPATDTDELRRTAALPPATTSWSPSPPPLSERAVIDCVM